MYFKIRKNKYKKTSLNIDFINCIIISENLLVEQHFFKKLQTEIMRKKTTYLFGVMSRSQKCLSGFQRTMKKNFEISNIQSYIAYE